ncbi:Phage terminase-like protein, large subunit, contains N-terminal HTH domain [Sphingomonas gellani]|uniref:Phage terminase-like protein, large subunit, contains N-terminal HTH domain n=1 Tax=Sphingomonas gellani TaxID=1166340 RepID=A0A1H8C224_9SPHN|nr:terminase TerL endonuclease subunit [Sphingomonas gellani]SEM88298.1 Phage terminase-like protein, large subunit, contains N-terminal HTH domain [Sphingomonas gellani]
MTDPIWTTACPDWEKRIVERQSLVPFAPLFPDQAAGALAVFKALRMVDVPGQPTFGEACEPFVFDLVAAIFGAFDPVAGRRLIEEFLLLISKKNGKSTIAAGIMLTALIRNFRHGAALSILAPTQKVAGNSFDPAAAMVRADPKLNQLMHIVSNQRLIKHRKTGAELRVIAADTQTVSGSKAGFVLVDELWVFGKRAGSESMLEEATGGLASRPEGFVIYLTTHSDEQPAGVFKDKLDYFRGVRDGTIDDPRSLGMLYEWPKVMRDDEAYLDPANFYVTNPNLGRSQSVPFIQRKLRLAKEGRGEDGDTSQQIVLAKYLNVEIGMRLSRDRWTGADFWDAASDVKLVSLDELIRRSEVVVAGVDGGGLDDLLGLCLIGREKGSMRWLVWTRAWAWAVVWDRRKDIVTKLDEFVAEGTLIRCDMPDDRLDSTVDDDTERDEDLTADVRGVVETLVKVRDAGLFPDKEAIGLDPVGVAAIVDELSKHDFEGQFSSISQGYKLSSAVKGSARKLAARTMRHGGTKLMQWCVGNAKMEPRGTSAVAIVKSSAGAKIDPLAAMFNAVMLMTLNPEAAGIFEPASMIV